MDKRINGVTGEVRSTVKVHPLRAEFRELKVRLVDVAAYVGTSYSTVAQWLQGYRRPSAVFESRLQAFAAQKRREREQAQALEQGGADE